MLFGTEKLEWCGYPVVKKIVKICLFVLTEFTNVADTRTDRRAPHDDVGRASIARQKSILPIGRPNYNIKFQ